MAVALPSFPALDESAGLIFALLPGLLAYLVHHELTARGESIDAIHAVLWGLASTLLVHALWWCAKAAGSLIPTPDIVGLPVTAVAIGIVGAWLTGTGIGYGLLHKIRLTRGSTHTTVWHSSFADFRYKAGEFAIFHMDDGSCYYGKICHYSRSPKDSHVLIDCYMLLSDGKVEHEFNESHVVHDRLLLLKADAVKYVEFLPHETQEDCRNGEATAPRAPTTAKAK